MIRKEWIETLKVALLACELSAVTDKEHKLMCSLENVIVRAENEEGGRQNEQENSCI